MTFIVSCLELLKPHKTMTTRDKSISKVAISSVQNVIKKYQMTKRVMVKMIPSQNERKNSGEQFKELKHAHAKMPRSFQEISP